MALKDSLKHFANTDGYSSVLTKSDYDTNLDTLADAIDDETTNRENADSAIQDELDNTQAGAGLGDDGSYNANGDANYISDAESLADADNKLDTQIKTNADAIDTKLDAVISVDSGSFIRNIKSATISTSDDTQTTILTADNLPDKAIVNIDIYSQNLQDDYSTKWIFKGNIYATIDDSGTITADKSLNDIVKDDTDWAFDITGNNSSDDTPASIDLKVTGKADTNIKWSVFLDIKVNKF